MNLFNRIVIILLILAAMLIIPLFFLFPEQAEYMLRYTADVIQANLAWMNTLAPTAYIGIRILLAGMGIIVFFIGVLFLALEVIRISRATVRLKDGGGEVMMDGIAGHLSYTIDLLADVLRVKPKVVSKGKSVQVELYVETAPGVNIPAKTAEIQAAARQVVEEQLGLRINGEVKVLIKPVSYPKSSKPRVAQPTATMQPTAGLSKPEAKIEPGQLYFAPPLNVEKDEAAESQIIQVKGPSEG